MQFQSSGKNLRIIGTLVSLAFLSYTSFVSAIEYGGFGGRPAFPREDNARTESIFIHTLDPGAVQKE